jgi:hypothetical protein
MKAFPTSKDNGHSENQDGMDLRDYFASDAMKGILANPDYTYANAHEIAEWSYMQADAMMKAREAK